MCADKTSTELDPFADYDYETIFACVARDELFRRWLNNGDERALEILLAASAPDLRSGHLRAERDVEIRDLAAWLETILSGTTRNAIAVMLASAGRAVAMGAPLRSSVFPTLDDCERAELAARLGKILAWAPGTTRGQRWPGKRQIDSIIK